MWLPITSYSRRAWGDFLGDRPRFSAYLAGSVALFVGLGVLGSGHALVGVLISVAGLIVAVSACAWHDRLHRQRGELGHVVWGPDDRFRPQFLRR